MLELNFSYHSYFQIDRTITHFSLLSGSQADNSLESNMATRRHIGLKNAKNNPRNEFPISKLCKIDPLHTFQPYVFQKLIIALNPIWRPEAILDLRHFPESDWWGFLGCDYWGTKGMKSAEKPFVRIFSTLNITVGLDWLAYYTFLPSQRTISPKLFLHMWHVIKISFCRNSFLDHQITTKIGDAPTV